MSRAPQGARGLKSAFVDIDLYIKGRAPQGARGLKWGLPRGRRCEQLSRPARGAWVEIGSHHEGYHLQPVAPRKGRVG